MLTITIPGKPISKHRPRFFRKGDFVGTYNDQKTEEGKFMLQAQAQIPPGWEKPSGPVRVTMHFFMPIPKSWPKHKIQDVEQGLPIWHDKRPDGDNLAKFVLDCLRDLLFADDATVASIQAVKLYAKNPATEITVQRLT